MARENFYFQIRGLDALISYFEARVENGKFAAAQIKELRGE